ncbi:hypothetical protein JQK15_20285 [Sphingobium sp. BHU LFT2]|uniref:imm11 family protein n=1 Tax=Sphingobium sp. BHU LFT2 TaxID=2807634 RepID=UPI001BEB1FEA|nr:DUF1629 domain-containing protein [Sphingobium sp. BHU LFT2]MBT2245854.1 hypothetical protein [Sphingobium sp. BHU LFT2]
MVYSLTAELRANGRAVIGYDAVPGDGDKLIEVADATPDGGLFFGHGRAHVSGRRVQTDHLPKQMKARTNGIIPDYGQFYGLKIVTAAFRDIVERLEPGVHQFLPMQIVGARRSVIANMFFMVVCNRLDSVDRQETTLLPAHGIHWMPGREVPREQWPPDFDPNVKGRVVFNSSQIGAHHLWYDKHHGNGPFMSDKLAETLRSAGMTGMNLVHLDEV